MANSQNTDKLLTEALLQDTPEKGLAKIFMEGLSRGTKVAVFQDPIYGMDGQQGVIDSESGDGGYMNVRFENGSVMPIISYFLIPLGS